VTDRLDRPELEERLALAERVCVLFGWSPVLGDSVREKATSQAWSEWVDNVGMDFLAPEAHPELSDEAIEALAVKRDEIRSETLRWIRGKDS
jgi:hypothetical protein